MEFENFIKLRTNNFRQKEMKKFKIVTFGCQMNEDDSNSIRNFLLNLGAEETKDSEKADILIINTCTVRQHAEDKAISLVGTLKKWKTREKKIIFSGCAAQRIGNGFKKKFPYIDYVIGAKSYNRIYDILLEEMGGKDNKNTEIKKEKRVFDYETILRGCNLKCSYCIVPYVRGNETPKSFKEIIESVKNKASEGVKEIILLGQTVNSYRDKKEGKDFTDLIREISRIENIKIIRFLSPHPLFFNSKFFDEYEKNPKISRWIHLPLQSASDKILKSMNRGYDIKKFKEIVGTLRNIDSKTSITTDIIVGYSDETKDDFKKTLDAVREIEFSGVYCFKYSPRFVNKNPLTITKEELEKRHNILLDEVKKIAKKILDRKVGSIEDVLIYSKKFGKTNTGYNCCIIDNKELKDDFLKVLITEVKNNTLYGRRYDEKR